MTDKINNISGEAVKKATGKDWDGWIRFIDGQGGAKMDHKAIVKVVAGQGKVESGWWQQMVTVGYEHAKGLRRTGQTADAGYQVGVQKTIPLGRSALWRLLGSAAGLRAWLGNARGFSLESGAQYRVRGGASGAVRTIRRGHRVRLSWNPDKRKQSTTLQITLSCPRNARNKTTLRFHHEQLKSKAERSRMQAHWKGVLDELARLASKQ